MQSFVVAVDGGWSDWSQWSHCTKNVIGIQMRTRQCENPKPQFGGKLCTGANATAIRGCTNMSGCRQGILKILKKNFVYPSPQGFLMISTVQSLLKANFLTALLFIGFFTGRYWGGHRSFDSRHLTIDVTWANLLLVTWAEYEKIRNFTTGTRFSKVPDIGS